MQAEIEYEIKRLYVQVTVASTFRPSFPALSSLSHPRSSNIFRIVKQHRIFRHDFAESGNLVLSRHAAT
jgi:hypothetical protein